MKITRRDFLKGTATTLFLAGFNLPALASSSRKKNLVGNYVTWRYGWSLCSSSNWR
jgi:anaerobic selenocysteine-containing dehydrogenase